MTNTENLRKIISEDSIEVYDFPFRGRNKGLYVDGAIGIADTIKSETEYYCILAEEIGHHKTSYGDILDQRSEVARKQEHRARAWAFKEMVMLPMIIEASKNGLRTWEELADFMGVTEQFLKDAISYFNSTYGPYKRVGNYIIYFSPFGVMEMLEGL